MTVDYRIGDVRDVMASIPDGTVSLIASSPPFDAWFDEYDGSHDDYRPGLVLDPFVGSGTTCCVAEVHGRDSIGIDLDPRNRDLLDRRMIEVKRSLFNTQPELPGQMEMAL